MDNMAPTAGGPRITTNGNGDDIPNMGLQPQTPDDENSRGRTKTRTSPYFSSAKRRQQITDSGCLGDATLDKPDDNNTATATTQAHTQGEVDGLLCRYYGPWSRWRRCNRRCQQTRVRKCRVSAQCGATKLRERRSCRKKRGRCSTSAAAAVFRRQTLGRLQNANKRLIERVLYDSIYADWSSWGSCTRSCKQRRRRRCRVKSVCDKNSVQQTRRCSVAGSRCERRHKPTDKEEDRPLSLATVAPTGTTPLPPTPAPTEGKATGQKDQQETGDHRVPEQGSEPDSVDNAQLTCGRRPTGTRGSYRVVGGQEAQRLSWPWQVAILTRWEEQYCAGTLIAPQWVLTAAHCVRKNGRRRRIIVRTGEHDLGAYEGSEDDIKPEREFPHPHFDYVEILNDIALVRLKDRPHSRSNTGHACLPEPGFTPDRDSLCYVLGWGKRRNTHLFGADVLHEAQMPLVSPKRCQRVFDYHINRTQVCAGYRRGGVDACAGDSGGPLLCPKTVAGETRWFVTGITSYGEGCGRKGKFGIYTRVASYRRWIADVTSSYER